MATKMIIITRPVSSLYTKLRLALRVESVELADLCDGNFQLVLTTSQVVQVRRYKVFLLLGALVF